MSTQTPTEASHYLLTLAQRNAAVWTAYPSARAAMVTGSVAEGVSDFYSDVDMSIYYDTLPTEAEMRQSIQTLGASEVQILGDPASGGCATFYTIAGVQCQVVQTTIARWEEDIATVREARDVASPLQKALEGTLKCLPLYGDTLIAEWKALIADYPDELARAMVETHLAFFPFWGISERFAVRDATLWRYQILLEAAQNLLGILAGLNHVYYSTFQFKRMGHFIAQMHYTPDNLRMRLEEMFCADTFTSAQELESLVADTLFLVESHMPGVDTAPARGSIGWRQKPWALPSPS